MAMTASDYVGTYYVKVVDEKVAPDLSRGDRIEIATDGVDETTAYVTITREGGGTIVEGAAFLLSHEFGCLRGDTLPIAGHVMLISRYEEQTLQEGEEKVYKALYGAIIEKDPDSVGTWGADDDPP